MIIFQQNIQNCSVCLEEITKIRNITDDLKFKINNCSDRDYYNHLIYENDKLCSKYYMKIINSYHRQKSMINEDNLIEISKSTTDLMKISSESNISTNLMEINESNTSTNLMEINNLIEISESNTLTNLMEINNLMETCKSNTSTNLIELIEIQKKELIENTENLNKINQQFNNIEINITNKRVLIDKENFDQLIKLIIQKNLKIEALTNQNNNNLTTINIDNSGFFEEMMDALIPTKRLIKNREKAKKQVVAYCYLLVGIRNKFANNFKLDLALFLQSSGMSNLGINILSNIGLS
ncbi:5385_t:CDS:2, partial [Cetraspora pellucida]